MPSYSASGYENNEEMHCAPQSPRRFKKPILGSIKRIKLHVLALGKSCLEIKTKVPGSASGVYVISATNIGKEFLKVYCEMTTDGGNVYSTARNLRRDDGYELCGIV